MKKKVWDITILREVTLRVSFDTDVNADEAMERYENDDYEDVLDERDSFDTEVISAHPTRT